MTIFEIIAILLVITAPIWTAVMMVRSKRDTQRGPSDPRRLSLPSSPAASLLHLSAVLCLVAGFIASKQMESVAGIIFGAGAALGSFASAVLIQYVFDIRNVALHRELTRDA